MFPGFQNVTLDVPGAAISGRVGGSGPPVLLLHGHPQTHAMWHRVAPALAERHTVVLTDLRGYGASSRPATTPDHAPYAKRAMAADQVEVMRHLGFDRFAVVGHDRGARVGYRLALDHPGAVDRLAVLDVVPTVEVFDRADASTALGLWKWWVMAQPSPLPETLIAADPDGFYFGSRAGLFAPEALAEYRRWTHDPATVHSMCEDYRAAATLDRAHDDADRGRRRITAPVLALWGKRSHTEAWYDVLRIWREWADDVRGAAVDCGHFLPEEAPEETLRHLTDFLAVPPAHRAPTQHSTEPGSGVPVHGCHA